MMSQPGVWTTGGLLERSVERVPDQTFLYFGDLQITFKEFDEQVNRVANLLADFGVKHGDRVAVIMANCPEFLYIYYGTGRLGAIFVPLVTQSKFQEIEYTVEHSDSAILFTDAERWGYIREARKQALSSPLNDLRAVVSIGGSDDDSALDLLVLMAKASTAPPSVTVAPDDLVALMYTSGTTGKPKGVMHTHYVAVAQAAAINERMSYSTSDRLLTIFPLYHGNALVWSGLTAMWASAGFIVMEKFSASRFWDQVRRYGATEVNLLEGALNMILAQPERPDDRDHPLRVTLATLTEGLYRRFTERFGVDVVTTWCLAEAPLGTLTAPGFGYTPKVVGWPMGTVNSVKVMDSEGNECPPGVIGELTAANDAVMKGYWKNPEETARVLRNGRVYSGDLGFRDDNGLFYFEGRDKHVIRRAGENVSGEEVEDAVNSHPAVMESAAVAVPDEIRGEEVKVLVVRLPGAHLTEPEVAEWCAKRLSNFKVPRYIEFRETLPKTGTERVRRHLLKAEPAAADCWDRMARNTRTER
jgi:crotonobetaine/carnitine-CoA ligase